MKNLLLLLSMFVFIDAAESQMPQTNLKQFCLFSGNFDIDPLGVAITNYGCHLGTDRYDKQNKAINISNSATVDPARIQHFEIPNPKNQFFSNDFTIIFWFKSDSINNGKRMYLLSCDRDGVSNNLNFELNDYGNAYYVYWNCAGSVNEMRGEDLNKYTDGKWHEVVLRRTLSLFELFIDMELKNQVNYSETIGSNKYNLSFGRNTANYGGLPNVFDPFVFNGSIDDIGLYKYSVSNQLLNNYYKNIIADFDFTYNTNDKSGFNNFITLESTTDNPIDNPVLINDRFGNCNSAFSFNGNGVLKIKPFATNPQLYNYNYFSNDFTISYWFKTTELKKMFSFAVNTLSNNLQVSLGNTDTPNAACITSWNSNLENNTIVASTSQPYLYSDDLWHQVVLVRNAKDSIISLFIDNELQGSKISNDEIIGSNLSDIYIGNIFKPYLLAGYSSTNKFGWNGGIDDIKFYNKALGLNEISALYNQEGIVNIKFPKSNNSWAIGSKHNITWTSAVNGLADISISYNNGNTWNNIATQLPSIPNVTNKYLWQIPNNTSQALIKIILNSYNTDDACNLSSIRKFNIIPSQAANNYQWTCVVNGNNTSCTINDSVPHWRDGADLKVLNNKLYLYGGWNPENPLNIDSTQAFESNTTNEIWSTTNGVNWTKERGFTNISYPNTLVMWEKRHVFANYKYNNELWLIGGDVASGHYQNDIWKTTDGVNWSFQGNLPNTGEFSKLPNRILPIYNNFNGSMWLMGGQTIANIYPTDNNIYYNDVYSYNGLNWQKHPNAPWSERGTYSGSVVLNNKMWVLGGGQYQGTWLNDVWSTTNGDNWTNEVDFAPWEGRQYHNTIVFDNKMWIIGGNNPNAPDREINTGNLKDVWYSADGVNWYELNNTPWHYRHGASVEILNNELYLMAGNNRDPDYLSGNLNYWIDVFKLTIQ